MEERGSITIISIILFSFIMVVILYLLNISETQMYFNTNSNESVQHKYILESHFNYMMNKKEYLESIDEFLKANIVKGKAVSGENFTIKEKISDSKLSIVKMGYDNTEDELIIYIENSYYEMRKYLQVKINPINPIFLNNNGIIVYDEAVGEEKENIYKLLNLLEQEYMEKKQNIIISKEDIIIDEDLKFEGIIISTRGKIIVENNIKLDLKGLLISNETPIGNIDIIKDDNIIKKAGVCLPGFIDYNIMSKHLKEGYL